MPHGPDGVHEPREEALEVVLGRLLDLASFDIDVIDGKYFLPREGFYVEPEGGDVFRKLLRRFLEGHENAGLAVFDGSANEKFHAQEGLAGAGASDEQGRASPRQAPARDLVQSVNARKAPVETFPRRCPLPARRHLSPPRRIH